MEGFGLVKKPGNLMKILDYFCLALVVSLVIQPFALYKT